MTGITRWALRHKRLVVLVWLVLTITGIATAQKATAALSEQYSIPGKQSYQVNTAILTRYDNGGDNAPLLAVVTVPPGGTVRSPAALAGVRLVTTRLDQAVPGARIASYPSTNDPGFVSRDGRTTFVLAYPPQEPGTYGQDPAALRRASAALHGVTVDGAPVYLTGLNALASAGGQPKGLGIVAEGMLGALGALVVLAFVFGSFLAIVPLLTALASIMTCFLAIWGLASMTSVSSIVEFLIGLVGLGIAIDYSLLVIVRWREERAHGHTTEEAIVRAMNSAGRAVVFSGTAVAVGLLSLIVLPVPFLRSVGYGGMLIPLVSVAATVTLLPVILATIGPRLDWPHKRTDAQASRGWSAWARLVVRRRWLAAGTALLVLGLLAGAASTMVLGPANGNPDTLSISGPARAGLTELEQSGIGQGVLTPIEILAPAQEAAGLAHALGGITGVEGVTAPASWVRDGSTVVDVFTLGDSASALAQVQLTARAHGAAVGGIDAENRDFISAVYGSFPLMIIMITVLAYVLLARAFRSLLLPAKAIALNILSVVAAWGALTLVWQHGFGSRTLWGIGAAGSIPSWLPMIVFAFLFGLSMDYEVFILARMREEYDATGSTSAAVVGGLGRTGRLVTSAAIILFLTFVSMSTAPSTMVKMIATGLGAGIILDATVIRALLVPATVALFGKWNWMFPNLAARLLLIRQPAAVEAPLPEPEPAAR
jgi:putative drug exporter of the RND superfamily